MSTENNPDTGADTQTEDPSTDEQVEEQQTDGEGEQEKVRDPEAVLAKNKELVRKLNEATARLDEFEKAAEERRLAEMSEAEKAIEAAEKAGYERAAQELGVQLLKERVIARAHGLLQDPTDAVALIDISELSLDDEESIDKALQALVEAKPHLRVRKGGQSIDQGPVGERTNASASPNDWLRSVIGR